MFTRVGVVCGMLFAMVLGTGCQLVRVEGNGVEGSVTKEIGVVREIEVSGGSFNTVDVYVCDCSKVVVTGDDNLLPYVNADQDGESLYIDTDEWLAPDLPLVMEIYTPYVDDIHVSGSSNLRVIDLTGGSLHVSTSGSSDVKLRGKLDDLVVETSGSSDIDIVELDAGALHLFASGSSDMELVGEVDVLEIETSGSSDIRAAELVAYEASVTTTGSSDVDVCVTERLDVSVSGSGDVNYYCGTKHVSKSVSGSGDVRRRD